MSNVRTKLEKAFDAMIEEGAKINASAVEKRAGVSNGSVSYYKDIEKKVLDEKLNQTKNKKKELSAETVTITKAKKESQREKAKETERLKSKYYKENQELKKSERKLGDEIANLI